MKTSWLLGLTATMVGLSVISMQPEFALPAILFGGAYVIKRRNEKVAQLEKRIRVAEGELESANTELEQLRVEREFDRKLLHDS